MSRCSSQLRSNVYKFIGRTIDYCYMNEKDQVFLKDFQIERHNKTYSLYWILLIYVVLRVFNLLLIDSYSHFAEFLIF